MDNIYETEYQRLAKRLGPYGSDRTRRDALQFWISRGRTAAQWLIFRTCSERKATVLMEVAYVLAQIGEIALDPILDALEAGCSRAHAEMLISATRRIQYESSPRVIAACRKYCED